MSATTSCTHSPSRKSTMHTHLKFRKSTLVPGRRSRQLQLSVYRGKKE